ncbi:MAG TPA: type II toxin-antitoxin system VapC family toxin [Thermomicrobiaceae bacterium]|nr:type II toxin-antitoxin system VapC family toxin [Thermomicrobiaceae bacterium]
MTGGATNVLLDASALLAYLRREPGGDVVLNLLTAGACITTINYAEVLTRLSDAGEDPATAHQRLHAQGLIGGPLTIVTLTFDDAVTIAQLRRATRSQGLSLGDRACLAAGLRLGLPVLTADRSWTTVNVGVTVQLIRT